ncbi:hypothetical protein HBA55_34280 [Pseudomaricurvus alkylphenolicus]|uniref:hypothetical protein n=1 Tax=Pseudomaricurvus alkylphenolicus TaxID=1306991 RepID=UPI001420511C|nr:hypothetical protein [Pseudomaricurvus alkylphenolicus]NIB44699.1 hypothetical protein [Pseudomaricurvus alkylphenolicus]
MNKVISSNLSVLYPFIISLSVGWNSTVFASDGEEFFPSAPIQQVRYTVAYATPLQGQMDFSP